MGGGDGGGGFSFFPFSVLIPTNLEESPFLHAHIHTYKGVQYLCPQRLVSFSSPSFFLLYIGDFKVCMIQIYILYILCTGFSRDARESPGV